jgi:hemolysin activation/secretion protein
VAHVRAADGTDESVWRGPPLFVGPADVLDLRDLEQTLENLQRTPGAQASVQIAPAALEGHSDLIVDYRLDRPLRAQLSLDDAGNRETGQWQANATLSWSSPLGLADLLYVSQGKDVGGRAAGPRGSSQQVLHYSLPLGRWLVAVTASEYSHHQTLPGPQVSNRYQGKASHTELKLARVVRRAMDSKTSLHVKAFQRRSRNFINDAEVHPQRRRVGGWEAGMDHTHYLGRSTLLASMNHRRGTGAFGSQRAVEERFGEGTSRMRVTQASVSLNVPWRWGDHGFRYEGQLRAQWDHTALLSQDRICIGGRYSVRGFDGVQALCGERGQVLRQELAWTPPGKAWQPYAALDIGRVSGPSAPARAVLTGWALGVRSAWVRGPLSLDLDLFIGRPISRPDGFETQGTTAGLSMNLAF